MGVKGKSMVHHTWLNVDFENSFGVDYLQQPLKWKEEPPNFGRGSSLPLYRICLKMTLLENDFACK